MFSLVPEVNSGVRRRWYWSMLDGPQPLSFESKLICSHFTNLNSVGRMSYAIETSKRKFERILNSISDELWKEDDRSTKRLRLSDISTRKPTSRLFRRKHPASTTSSTTAREEKAYSPFDRREFDRRLSSFRTNVSDWPPKPERINEVKWALRGWELAGKNTVACQRCSNRVTVDIEQNELGSEESEIDRERRRTETEESLIALYYDRIIDGHVGSCPWRQRGCNGEPTTSLPVERLIIRSLPLSSPFQWVQQRHYRS